MTSVIGKLWLLKISPNTTVYPFPSLKLNGYVLTKKTPSPSPPVPDFVTSFWICAKPSNAENGIRISNNNNNFL